MASRASVAKHPIHAILVPFPIGLWVFALIADIILAAGGRPVWGEIAFYSIVVGTIGALLAAVPGLIDLLSIRERRAWRIGFVHMGLNVLAVLLFLANLGVRMGYPPESRLPLVLSVIGVALIAVSGWLGGELVYVHGMGVEPERPVAGATEIRVHAEERARRA